MIYVIMCRINMQLLKGGRIMKHIKTINTNTLNRDLKNIGCGECQTSCVANQKCEKHK